MNNDPLLPHYKLILTYDMQDEQVQEYYRFVLGRYIPVMRSIGWEMVEAWATSYGDGPDRTVIFVNHNDHDWQDLFEDETWHELNHQLLTFITDFNFKVVPYRQTFQI